MSSNLPILYRNIMDGLPSDFARDVFLWAAERPGEDFNCYRAEAFAREMDAMLAWLNPILTSSAHLHRQNRVDPDLKMFLVERAANAAYGGNTKLPPDIRFDNHA